MKHRRFEVTLALVLAVLFTYAAAVSREQSRMADDLLRLHVVAHSDMPHDQQTKLMVRDVVLEFCAPILKDARSRAEVREALPLQSLVDHVQRTLWQMGEQRTVSVRLAEEYYPTRDYTAFSLPAGQYLGLRVTIGEGAGRNWWCVVFPPLCNEVAASQDSAAHDVRKDEQEVYAAMALHKDALQEDAMVQATTLRFKTAELVGALRRWLFC